MKKILPELKIYTNNEDIKYLLFEQEDVISDVIRERGYWNNHLILLVRKILSKQPAGNVIDIGAGIGTFSVIMGCLENERFNYKAFEPLKIIFMQLAANVLLNNLDNVRIHNVALGDTEKRINFNTLDVTINANHGSFSFNEKINEIRNIVNTEKKETYEFRKLDSFKYENVRFIKLSAPGMELEVLKGAKETILNNGRPPILFEAWQEKWYEEELNGIFDFLKDLQYGHFLDLNGYYIAFKSEAQCDYFMSDETVVENGEFIVSEKMHDTDETLKDQKVYTP